MKAELMEVVNYTQTCKFCNKVLSTSQCVIGKDDLVTLKFIYLLETPMPLVCSDCDFYVCKECQPLDFKCKCNGTFVEYTYFVKTE